MLSKKQTNYFFFNSIFQQLPSGNETPSLVVKGNVFPGVTFVTVMFSVSQATKYYHGEYNNSEDDLYPHSQASLSLFKS